MPIPTLGAVDGGSVIISGDVKTTVVGATVVYDVAREVTIVGIVDFRVAASVGGSVGGSVA